MDGEDGAAEERGMEGKEEMDGRHGHDDQGHVDEELRKDDRTSRMGVRSQGLYHL